MKEKIKPGIHKFHKGDIVLIDEKNFIGVVCKVAFTHLHKHPYIKVIGVSGKCFDFETFKIYSTEGVYKLGELK